MADSVTIANITPAYFQKYIMAETLPESYQEGGLDPTLVLGPTQNWKICHNSSDIYEIQPPYVRKVPNEISMIIDYVDSNIKNVSIEFQDGTTLESLKLTPNPDTMVISSSKIINRYNTMTRWVEEHWGDEVDNINFSGSTYSFNVKLGEGDYLGLTSKYRNFSESYHFLKTLVDIYRTNGYLYQEKNGYALSRDVTTDEEYYQYTMMNRFLLQNPNLIGHHPRHGMLRERLYNRISFDYVTFLGYFESFDITEDSSSPYKLIYSVVFKAEKTIWMVG